MRIARGPVLAVTALLVGCGAPPANAPSPVAGVSAPLVAPVSTASALADSPPPPLDRDFVHVPLPEGVGTLASISGRDPNEVWILSDEGSLLRLEGDRLVKTYQPELCFTTNVFQWIAVSAGDGIRLLAQYQDPGGRLLSAPFDPIKGVVGSCGSSADFLGLDCPWHHAWGAPTGDGRQCTLGGNKLPDFDPFVPQDTRVKIEIASASVKGDDGWFVANLGEGADQRTEIHRYNGVTWVLVGVLEKGLSYVASSMDKAGHGWILVKPGGGEGPATGIVRLDGRTLTRVPVPPSFEADMVQAPRADTAWFLSSKTKVFEWDGHVLREGEAPFAPRDVWASSSGDLWIVGEKENELVHTTPGQVAK